MKKYELTAETRVICGKTLHRIRALVAFSDVSAGSLGGWIEKEENLSHDGDAWVYGDACVYDNARVYDNAWIYGSACIYDNAQVYGNAWVHSNALIYDNARIYDKAQVSDNVRVWDNAQICGRAKLFDNVRVSDNVWIGDFARIYDYVEISGNARVGKGSWACGKARISCDARIEKGTHLLQIGGIGSRDDITTFFRSKDNGISVACGCFLGTIQEFAEKVKKTHGDSKHAKVYLAAIELAKLQLDDVVF